MILSRRRLLQMVAVAPVAAALAPKIPEFVAGGVCRGSHLLTIGEREPEVIAPLSSFSYDDRSLQDAIDAYGKAIEELSCSLNGIPGPEVKLITRTVHA